uniref:Multidrug-efflux transporter n=1 Tax=Candidatus Kentrum sp. FW TaxID=2126338 RepID=A0A450U4B6_9GAMM|nr:MAG: multidrug resistance protein, MATE family [Candidatus Kentron sp. FW]
MSHSKLPTASELGDILKISVPMSLGYLGHVAIGITDNIMLGRLGTDALGAAGLALSIYGVILTIGMGMLFPVLVLVPRALGAGRSRTTTRIIRQGLWMAGILSIPSCAILWNLEKILLAAGQMPVLARMAGHYMDYFLWTVFPLLTAIVFSHAFIAVGRTVPVALISWFAVGLNTILNYALIFGKFGAPAMGMAGAGLASVIVYGTVHMIFFTSLALHRFFRHTTVFRRAWKPEWTILGQFLRLGWPKAFELTIKDSLYSVVALLAGWFGVQAVAAHTIAAKVYFVVNLVISTAVADAITARMGIAVGRKDYTGIWDILNSGLLLCAFLMLPVVVVLKLFSPWVVMLFVGSGAKAQALMPTAVPLIVIIAFFMLLDSLRVVAGYALNGVGDMKAPALITAVSYWGIGLPCCIVFGFIMEMGVLGLWWGLLLGMSVTAITYLVRFRWVMRDFSST